MKYPIINYDNHPAYKQYKVDISYDSNLITDLINRCDSLTDSFIGASNLTLNDAFDAISDLEKITQRASIVFQDGDSSILAKEWTHSCFNWVVRDLSIEFTRLALSNNFYKSLSLSSEYKKNLNKLIEEGMYITQIPSDIYRCIVMESEKFKKTLKEKAESDKINRSVTNIPFQSTLWRLIERASKESGIVNILSNFKKNDVTLLGAGLEYSSSSQTWYRGVYSDLGLEDSKLQYLHIDEGDCYPKAMIYITPVGVDNGPTRAMPGSNQWARSKTVIRLHKALDRVVGDRYEAYAKNSHYRPIASHKELREVFMSLPNEMRGSSHFGDDILRGSDIESDLIDREFSYISEGPQALVFDGPHLLHRGSLIRSGERMAIQVIYRNRNAEKITSIINNESYLQEQYKLALKYSKKIIKNLF